MAKEGKIILAIGGVITNKELVVVIIPPNLSVGYLLIIIAEKRGEIIPRNIESILELKKIKYILFKIKEIDINNTKLVEIIFNKLIEMFFKILELKLFPIIIDKVIIPDNNDIFMGLATVFRELLLLINNAKIGVNPPKKNHLIKIIDKDI